MTQKPATQADEHPWPQALVRTAIVSGAFCAVVAVLLVINLFQSRALDPLKAPRLKDLKARLVNQPDNEALKKQVRALDLDYRAAHARRVALQQRGGWLLIGGGVVFLFAMQAALYRKKLPRPQKPVRQHADDERATMDTRWAVAAVGVALGAAAWTCVAQSQTSLAAPTAGPEYGKGVELIYQRLLETLRKAGLEPLATAGRPGRSDREAGHGNNLPSGGCR